MVSREQEKVIDFIREKGPCTGLAIKKEIDIDSLTLWKECRRCGQLDIRSLGTRYLRLDRHVEGYARSKRGPEYSGKKLKKQSLTVVLTMTR